MKNVTITLPDDLARWLRVRAAEDDRSVSRWIADLLAGMRGREDEYDVAMKRYLTMRPQESTGRTAAGRPGRSSMTAPVFVDTNVIVYRFDTTDPRKQSRAGDWFTLLWNRRSGRVSFQMLQEAYAVLTRKLKPAMASGRCAAAGRRKCWTCSRAGALLDRNPNNGHRKPDLFAGGSAIPLEAARLGCESHALDAPYRTPRIG